MDSKRRSQVVLPPSVCGPHLPGGAEATERGHAAPGECSVRSCVVISELAYLPPSVCGPHLSGGAEATERGHAATGECSARSCGVISELAYLLPFK